MKIIGVLNQIVKSSDVIGKSILDTKFEKLGTIEEIVLDKVNGEVRYVVLSFGGFMGLGGKLFALPWSSIHFDIDKNVFILNVSKENLKNSPGFNKDSWPDFANSAYRKIEHNFYDDL